MLQKYNIIMIKRFIFHANLYFGAKLMNEEIIVNAKKEFCSYV